MTTPDTPEPSERARANARRASAAFPVREPPSAEAVLCGICGEPAIRWQYDMTGAPPTTAGSSLGRIVRAWCKAHVGPSQPNAPEEAVPGALEAIKAVANDHTIYFENRIARIVELADAALAAVRAEPPREEGGAALEAALSELEERAGRGKDLSAEMVLEIIAAARAPGPVGGEAKTPTCDYACAVPVTITDEDGQWCAEHVQ